MPFQSREIIHAYALEIISRSQIVQGRCKKLLASDFASEAPKDLAKTIISMCSYLEKVTKTLVGDLHREAIDEERTKDLVTHLQDIDFIIREVGSHMRYIDGARTQRLPWSIIKPFEKFAENHVPGVTIMLRPQWKYNYSVVTTDICQKYIDYLSEYEDFLPDVSIRNEVFRDFKKPFHIIAFPSIEKKTILLHCLIGHEIGHLISSKYLTKDRLDQFLKDARNKIISIIQKRQDPKAPPLLLQLEIQQEIERAATAWIRGLEEILSDIVGTFLFGPAVLFSSFEIAIQDELDWIPNPKNSYYPPWRFRLREIQKIIEDPSQEFFPLSEDVSIPEKTAHSVNRRFELIKEMTAKDRDIATINQDEVLKIVYVEMTRYIDEAKKIIYEDLKDKIIKPENLYKKLHHLIKRLDCGIPPNAYEKSINDREPAKIEEIINAAWFHKISWEDEIFNNEGIFNEKICKTRDIMNRLTLKAIEYADVEEKYREHVGKPPKFEVKKS